MNSSAFANNSRVVANQFSKIVYLLRNRSNEGATTINLSLDIPGITPSQLRQRRVTRFPRTGTMKFPQKEPSAYESSVRCTLVADKCKREIQLYRV